MAMRTLNDPITQLTLTRLDEEIRCASGDTKEDLQRVRSKAVLECLIFEQQLKEKANGN